MSRENAYFSKLSANFRERTNRLTAANVIESNKVGLQEPLKRLAYLLDMSKLHGKATTIKYVTEEVREQLDKLGQCIYECHNSTDETSAIDNAVLQAIKENLEGILIENFNYLALNEILQEVIEDDKDSYNDKAALGLAYLSWAKNLSSMFTEGVSQQQDKLDSKFTDIQQQKQQREAGIDVLKSKQGETLAEIQKVESECREAEQELRSVRAKMSDAYSVLEGHKNELRKDIQSVLAEVRGEETTEKRKMGEAGDIFWIEVLLPHKIERTARIAREWGISEQAASLQELEQPFVQDALVQYEQVKQACIDAGSTPQVAREIQQSVATSIKRYFKKIDSRADHIVSLYGKADRKHTDLIHKEKELAQLQNQQEDTSRDLASKASNNFLEQQAHNLFPDLTVKGDLAEFEEDEIAKALNDGFMLPRLQKVYINTERLLTLFDEPNRNQDEAQEKVIQQEAIEKLRAQQRKLILLPTDKEYAQILENMEEQLGLLQNYTSDSLSEAVKEMHDEIQSQQNPQKNISSTSQESGLQEWLSESLQECLTEFQGLVQKTFMEYLYSFLTDLESIAATVSVQSKQVITSFSAPTFSFFKSKNSSGDIAEDPSPDPSPKNTLSN